MSEAVDHLDQRGCEQCADRRCAARRSVERRRPGQHRHQDESLAPRRAHNQASRRATCKSAVNFAGCELLRPPDHPRPACGSYRGPFFHNRTFVYVEKLAEYRLSPAGIQPPEPGDSIRAKVIFAESGGNSMFFVPLAIDKTFQMTPSRNSPENAADEAQPCCFLLHRQRPLFRPPSFAAKVLPQHDVQQYEGMTRRSGTTRAPKQAKDPQWAGAGCSARHARLPDQCNTGTAGQKTAGRIVKIVILRNLRLRHIGFHVADARSSG